MRKVKSKHEDCSLKPLFNLPVQRSKVSRLFCETVDLKCYDDFTE